jgi:hypothetical protein
MLDREFAEAFAKEWIAAWNSHDLERIFSHYTHDFEMSSPFIVHRMGDPSGTLRGVSAIRPYWERSLTSEPPLRFEFERVLVGVASITIEYRRHGSDTRGAEVLFFNADRKVVRGVAHYS